MGQSGNCLISYSVKRLILSIVTILYFSTTIGANLHLHYCMGELACWGLWKDRNEQCGKCGMDKEATESNGCCKDDSKQIKLEVDQKGNKLPFQNFSTWPIEITDSNLYTNDRPYLAECSPIPLSTAPPRGKNLSVYLLNCTFRI